MIDDERLIIIKSIKSGLHKDTLAIQAINYCIERNHFPDGAYQIEARNIEDCHTFLSELFYDMKLSHLEDQTKDTLYESIAKEKLVLLIT